MYILLSNVFSKSEVEKSITFDSSTKRVPKTFVKVVKINFKLPLESCDFNLIVPLPKGKVCSQNIPTTKDQKDGAGIKLLS